MEAAYGAEGQQGQAPGQVPTGDVPLIGTDEPVTNINEAVEKILNDAAVEGGIRIGVNQVIKAIEAQVAHYVFLAEDIEETNISRAVTLLAQEKNIKVINVPSAKDLGKWAGLCRIDREGQPRQIRGASCVALIKCSSKSNASAYLEKHVAQMA